MHLFLFLLQTCVFLHFDLPAELFAPLWPLSPSSHSSSSSSLRKREQSSGLVSAKSGSWKQPFLLGHGMRSLALSEHGLSWQPRMFNPLASRGGGDWEERQQTLLFSLSHILSFISSRCSSYFDAEDSNSSTIWSNSWAK